MEAEKIEIVKEWPEPKSVRDIQVFLGFANFYQWFIQSFSKIAAPLTSMLKTTLSSEVRAADEVLVANEVSSVEGGGESIEKCGKLSKTEKSSKSRNTKDKKSAKSKKPSKSGNSPNFDVTKAGPSFLTPKARSAFNRLRLTFIKALILRHFDPECHIRIETDALSYAIGGVLTQLASGTSPDRVLTKTNLGQWQSSIFGSSSPPITRTIQKNRQRYLLPSIRPHQWLSPPLHPG